MRTVLFIHHVSSIGGGSYCLLSIIKSMDRSKMTPVVCLASQGPLKTELERMGVKVILFEKMASVPYNDSLLRPRSLRCYFKVWLSFSEFKTLLKTYRIDIVYMNNMMLYPYLKPAKQSGCKTIIHVREHWPRDENIRQLQWARNIVGSYADRLITINGYSSSMFPDKESVVVYDWIDLSEREGAVSLDDIFGEDTRDLKIYLYMGGILRIKGAYPVVSTFSKAIKDSDARLLLMGYDMERHITGWKWRLKQVLFRLGFDINEMKVREVVANDSRIVCVPATYQIADILREVYCNLSFFTIPHANLALAESIISGTPIIAARTEEAVEYSCGSSLSRLFEINDVAAFSAELARMNESRAEALSNPCSDAVANLFSKERNVSILKNLIENL